MERYQKRDAAWKLAQLATQIFIAQCPVNMIQEFARTDPSEEDIERVQEEMERLRAHAVDQATDILTHSAASVGLAANDVGLEA